MFRKISLFLVFFILLGTVNAGCDGDLSLSDLPENLVIGTTYPILVTSSISPSMGLRFLDFKISDPEGHTITPQYNYFWSNSSFMSEFRFNASSLLIDGTYKIYAKINVFNTTNVAEKICEEDVEKNVHIHSNRTEYDDPIIIQILPDYHVQKTSYTTCLNISILDEKSSASEIFPICVDIKNVDANTQIGVKRIVEVNISQYNVTNSSIEISGNDSLFPSSFLKAIIGTYANQSSDLSQVRDELKSLKDNMQAQINNLQVDNAELSRRNENLSATLIAKGKEDGGEILGIKYEFIKGILVCVVLVFIMIFLIGKRKLDEAKK